MSELDLCIRCFRQIGGAEVCPYCGAVQKLTPKEAFHLHPRTVLNDRYVIGEVVGYGGFGVTYKALDMRLNEIVAIKEYFPAGLVNRVPGETEVIKYPGEKGKSFAEGKEKFLKEARNTAKFSNNPNIVNVFDFFEANETAYIIMEFLDGISLKQYMKQCGGKLDVQSSLEIINSVISGLKEVHKAGIVHRDISPDNIFLTSSNKIKIIDFGAARFSSSDQESTFSIIIKQGYAPPEQYRGKSKQGAFTDVYAVGAMLYAMLTGEVPEESVDRQIEDTLQPPSALESSIPKYLDNVIMKALSIKSELRFQNMEQFSEALLGKKSVLNPEDELKRRQKRRKIAFSIIGAVIGICICVGVVFKLATQDVNLNRYIKEDAVIEVWVPVQGDEEAQAATQSIYNEIYQGFSDTLAANDSKKALKAALDVHITYIPAESYKQAIADAQSNGTMPDVFRTDLAEAAETKLPTADLSWIRKKIIRKEYALYDQPERCTTELPVSTDARVLYINNKFVPDGALDHVYSVEALTEKITDLPEGVAPLSINPVYFEDHGGELKKAKLGIYSSEEEGVALQNFTSAKAACYLGEISELPEIKDSQISWYKMSHPIEFGTQSTYAETWGVAAQADESRQYAAMYVLSWLLTEDAQEILYIDNDSFVPLNVNTRNVYVQETHRNDALEFLIS